MSCKVVHSNAMMMINVSILAQIGPFGINSGHYRSTRYRLDGVYKGVVLMFVFGSIVCDWSPLFSRHYIEVHMMSVPKLACSQLTRGTESSS